MIYINGTIINEEEIETAIIYEWSDTQGLKTIDGTKITYKNGSISYHENITTQEIMVEINLKKK